MNLEAIHKRSVFFFAQDFVSLMKALQNGNDRCWEKLLMFSSLGLSNSPKSGSNQQRTSFSEIVDFIQQAYLELQTV